MVAAQEGDPVRVAGLEAHEQRECLHLGPRGQGRSESKSAKEKSHSAIEGLQNKAV